MDIKFPEFPVPYEDFISDQERLCGRTLDEDERKIALAYIEIINDIYREAVEGGSELAAISRAIIQGAMREHEGSDPIVRFLAAVMLWCNAAIQQGHMGARKEATCHD